MFSHLKTLHTPFVGNTPSSTPMFPCISQWGLIYLRFEVFLLKHFAEWQLEFLMELIDLSPHNLKNKKDKCISHGSNLVGHVLPVLSVAEMMENYSLYCSCLSGPATVPLNSQLEFCHRFKGLTTLIKAPAAWCIHTLSKLVLTVDFHHQPALCTTDLHDAQWEPTFLRTRGYPKHFSFFFGLWSAVIWHHSMTS